VRAEALCYYRQRTPPQRGLVVDVAATGDRELDLVIDIVGRDAPGLSAPAAPSVRRG
jgi:hypothetical protein